MEDLLVELFLFTELELLEGLVLEGLVLEGLVLEGLVLEGLVLEGLVLEGLVLEGLVLEGLVLEGLVLFPIRVDLRLDSLREYVPLLLEEYDLLLFPLYAVLPA